MVLKCLDESPSLCNLDTGHGDSYSCIVQLDLRWKGFFSMEGSCDKAHNRVCSGVLRKSIL